MADIELTIRLHPGGENPIQLSQGNGNRPLFGVYVDGGDRITWTSEDQGKAPRIEKWLVSFIRNEWGQPPQPSKAGTPLRDGNGEEVWQVYGAPTDGPVETWVSEGGGDFQFAVAVLDEYGRLYALDPEIRVRPGLRG